MSTSIFARTMGPPRHSLEVLQLGCPRELRLRLLAETALRVVFFIFSFISIAEMNTEDLF